MVVTSAPSSQTRTFEVVRGMINPNRSNVSSLKTSTTEPPKNEVSEPTNAEQKEEQTQMTSNPDTKAEKKDASNPPAETVEQPENASSPQDEQSDSVFQALDEAVLSVQYNL